MTFENEVINNTVSRLLKGEDYREEVVNSINAVFFDFTLDFSRKLLVQK